MSTKKTANKQNFLTLVADAQAALNQLAYYAHVTSHELYNDLFDEASESFEYVEARFKYVQELLEEIKSLRA